MAFDFMAPLDNLPNAEILASMIATLDQDDWRNYLRQNGQDLPIDISAWSTRDSNEQSPRCIKVQLQQGTLILIQGVKRYATALALMNAYGDPPRQNRPAGLNAQVRRAVEDMWTEVIGNSDGVRNNVLIAGHSYGAAVAVGLANEILWNYSDKNVRVVTFGSPKPGTYRFGQENQSLSVQRYWNSDDPIRLMCPSRLEAPAAHAMLRSPFSSRWADHTHVGNGIMIMPSGTVQRLGYNLPAGEQLTEITLVGWAAGILSAPVQAHSIHEYYLRLGRANERGLSIGTERPGAPYRARRTDANVPQPTPVDVPQVQNVMQALEVAVAAERTIPQPRAFSEGQTPAGWGVFRGEELIVMAATRTRARSISRTGNDILRDMMARGTVDEEALRRVMRQMLK